MPVTTHLALERAALSLLRELMDLAPAARDAHLAERSTGNPALAARVQALLAQFDEDDTQAPVPESDKDAAGLSIGPYRVLRRIGRGGMGEVFLAERSDGAYQRQVALKRIWGGIAPLTERFLRERSILARLTHPNIAQLYDGGVSAGEQPWFALEYIDGAPLTHWCDAQRAPLAQRVDLLRQLCLAVQFAHANLIVHRDIKPANVLVGADGIPKLLDFGIAKLLDEADPQATQTLAMTPAWSAPEQRSGGALTTATDVWQLGMLLRVLLGGETPRTDSATPSRLSASYAALRRNDATTAHAVAQARNTTPERLRTQLTGDLEHIVALATAEHPRERYASAQTFAEDLQRWDQHLPVHARRHERGYRMRRALRRYWPAVAAATVGAAFLGYHLVSLDHALQRAKNERSRALTAETQAATQRQRAERERDTAQAVSRYFVTLFRAASPAATRGGEVTAKQLLADGQAQLEKLPPSAQSPRALGAIWQALGRVHNELGDYPRSLALQQRAVAAVRGHDDPAALAEALRAEGWAHYFLDDAEAFLSRAREAEQVLIGAGLTRDPVYAPILNAVGFGYFVNGQGERSWKYFDASVALARELGSTSTEEHIRSLVTAAAAALEAGENGRAVQWLTDAEAAAPTLSTRSVDSELMVGINLATALRRLDRLNQARQRMTPLMRRARDHYGAGHPRWVYAQIELAALDLAENRPDQALANLHAIDASLDNTFPAGHGTHADIAGLRGIALLMQSDIPKARDVLQRVRAMRGDTPSIEIRPLLERAAQARASCDPQDLQTSAQRFQRARNAEPWQRRLLERWRQECAATSSSVR